MYRGWRGLVRRVSGRGDEVQWQGSDVTTGGGVSRRGKSGEGNTGEDETAAGRDGGWSAAASDRRLWPKQVAAACRASGGRAGRPRQTRGALPRAANLKISRTSLHCARHRHATDQSTVHAGAQPTQLRRTRADEYLPQCSIMTTSPL